VPAESGKFSAPGLGEKLRKVVQRVHAVLDVQWTIYRLGV